MAEAQFDPSGFYQFDLHEGSVRSKDGARVLVLSDTSLAPLVSAAVRAGEVGALVGLGNQLGTAAKDSLGADPAVSSKEGVLAHAQAVVALFGWGKLGFETWGDALVVSLEGGPELADGDAALAALLTGLLSAIGDQPADCVATGGGRFLVLAPDVADAVRGWVEQGEGLAGIVARLGVSS